jgi:hypothetical protein
MLYFFPNPTGPFVPMSVCPTAKDRKRLEKCPVLGMDVPGPLSQHNCINMQELQGTIIVQIPLTFLF